MNRFYGMDQHRLMRSQQGMRIAVIPERYGEVMSPCASIRLHAFTEHFPADVRYLGTEELAAFSPHLVLWNRGAIVTESDKAMLVKARQRGAKLIYDLDDNLLAMDEHPEREAYSAIVGAVRASIALADVTWCSTPRLVEVVNDAGGAAQWMPNALDAALWRQAADAPVSLPATGVLRLLYMGTRTHDDDFRMLDAALQLAWDQRPHTFSLTLIGVNAAATSDRAWIEDLRPPAHVGASYPAFVHWFSRLRGFHAGMAPLLSTAFNRCKSSIKVLDYAAMGVATLASRVPAYEDDAHDDRVLIDNTPQAWAAEIISLVDRKMSLDGIALRAISNIGQAACDEAVARRWNSCRQVLGK